MGKVKFYMSHTMTSTEITEEMRVNKVAKQEDQIGVREVAINIDAGDGCVKSYKFRRYDTSKHKVNPDTAIGMSTHINHFFDWVTMQDNQNYNDALIHLINDLDTRLNVERVGIECRKILSEKIKDEPDILMNNIELEYTKDVLRDLFLSNYVILDMIINYTKEISVSNIIVDASIENKLTEEDCTVIHSLILYSKLLYVGGYMRVSIGVQFINVVKAILIELGEMLNDRIHREVNPHGYNETFISRLYHFLLNACSIDYDRHAANLTRFAITGISKDSSGILNLLNEILSSFHRVSLIIKDKDNKDKVPPLYSKVEDWHVYGLVSKNTASYIQNTKKSVVNNDAGVIKPDYIIKMFSNDDKSGEVMSQTSRYDIQSEKTDKEQFMVLKTNAKYIINDILSKMTMGVIVDNLYAVASTSEYSFRTDLNKFVVSHFLESVHHCDVSGVLTLKEFIIVAVYCYELLDKYPSLAAGVIAKMVSRVNANPVDDTLFDGMMFTFHNKEKVIDFINKVASKSYIIVTKDNSVSRQYNISEELVLWIKDGMRFDGVR